MNQELAHQSRERRAWEAFEVAMQLERRDEAVRLWRAFAAIHAQRPAGLVRRMEIAKGLA